MPLPLPRTFTGRGRGIFKEYQYIPSQPYIVKEKQLTTLPAGLAVLEHSYWKKPSSAQKNFR
jgi:hypothetical protein